MSEPAHPDLEALLAQSGWIRHVARGLVADTHLAEDLVQDAWVAALEGHTNVRGSLRGWLAALVRNFARQRWRQEMRREQREILAARGDETAAHDELLERLDVHRALVEELAALEDPYRSAILLRYFEGLGPKAIAERTRTPVRTVHSHLHRGLEQLRDRLDRRMSRRSDWMLALLPLPNKPSWLDAFRFGARVMVPKLKFSWIAASVAGLLACSWIFFASREDREPRLANAEVALGADSVEVSPLESTASLPSTRTSAASGDVGPSRATRTAAMVRGHVVDARNVAVGFVTVRFTTNKGETRPEWQLESASDGAFAIAGIEAEGFIEVVSDELVTVMRPIVQPGSPIGTREEEHTLVVARSARFAGTARDDRGDPVPRARISVRVPPSFRSEFDRVLDSSLLLEWRTETDDEGRFEIARAPVIARAKLAAVLDGCEVRTLEAPDGDRFDLRFVLCRPNAEAAVITGHVLESNGDPVEAAWVALGDTTVRTDARGAFVMRVAQDESARSLVAVKTGRQPARYEHTGEWPASIDLVLGPPTLSIRGRVRELDGRALEGVEVWAVESTPFGSMDARPWGINGTIHVQLEQVLREKPLEDRVRTDGGGAFAIEGLLPRTYRLCVFDSRSVRVVVTPPIEAGSTIADVVLPNEERYARVAGRVVDRTGKPVVGAEVMLVRDVPALEGAPNQSPSLWTQLERTDTEGRFEFESVSRVGTIVRVCAITFDSAADVVLAAQKDVEQLDIAIALKAHLQVDVHEFEADRFEVLDTRGQPMRLVAMYGNIAAYLDTVRLDAGRSEVVIASEDATELVFYSKDVEVKRASVRLVPGELNVVRL